MGKDKYNFRGVGLTAEERKVGKKRFEKYRRNYNIDRYSDLQLLEEKIFREIQQDNLKYKIGEIQKKNENPPAHMFTSLDENLERIITIDEKLGLFDKKEQEDIFNYIESLKKKFTKWEEDNWDARKITCCFCGKVFFLHIRTDKYEAKKSPFFENRVLANKPLFEIYRQGKLTKEEVARILNTSLDGVDWLEKKFIESSENK